MSDVEKSIKEIFRDNDEAIDKFDYLNLSTDKKPTPPKQERLVPKTINYIPDVNYDMLASLIRHRLLEARERMGVSAATAAEGMKLSPQTISKAENGRIPTVETLYRASLYYGVSLDWLCGRDTSAEGAEARADMYERYCRLFVSRIKRITALVKGLGACADDIFRGIPSQIAEVGQDTLNKFFSGEEPNEEDTEI